MRSRLRNMLLIVWLLLAVPAALLTTSYVVSREAQMGTPAPTATPLQKFHDTYWSGPNPPPGAISKGFIWLDDLYSPPIVRGYVGNRIAVNSASAWDPPRTPTYTPTVTPTSTPTRTPTRTPTP